MDHIMRRKEVIIGIAAIMALVIGAMALIDQDSEDTDALSSSYIYYYIHDPDNRITVDLNNSGALGPYGSKANDDFHYKVPAGKTIKLSTSYSSFYRWLQVSDSAGYNDYHFENPQTISGTAGNKYDIWMLYYNSAYAPSSSYATYAMLKTPCADSFSVGGSRIGADSQFVYYRVVKGDDISISALNANATITKWHQKNYATNNHDSFNGASGSIDGNSSTIYYLTPQYYYPQQSYFSVLPSTYETTPGSTVTITASDKVDPAVLTWQVTTPSGTSTLSNMEGCKSFTYTLSNGGGTYTFKATQNGSNSASTAITAVEYKTVTFAVNNSSYGSVSRTSLSVPSGSSISVSGNTVTIDGTTVTATAKAADSNYTYAFSSWTNASGTVTANKTITANFTATSNTMSITVYKGNWYSFKWYGGTDSTTYTSTSHTYTVPIGTSFDIDWQGKATENGSYYTTTYTGSCSNMSKTQYGTSLGDSVTTVAGTTKYYPAEQMSSTTTYQYVIEYNANGGSGAPANTTSSGTSTSKSITLSTTKPTWSGHTFLGWATSSTATSATYTAGTAYTFSYGKTTLYAVWQESKLTIGSVAKQYAVVGQGVSFTATCTPSSGVSYGHSNVTSGLTVSESGSTITCNATTPGTYTFTLTASKSGYTSSSVTVTVEFVPLLAFTNAPSIGVIGS